MAQAFVISMKFMGDAQSATAAATAARAAVASVGEAARQAETAEQRLIATTLNLGRVQDTINSSLSVRDGFGTEKRAADIEAYGRELDELRAKFNPLFAVEQRHAAVLSEIASAHRVGAISSDEMAAALAREEAAFQRTTAALRAETAALAGNNAMSRRAIAQRANLVFQLNDIGVSLASGMNPLLVFAQQGSQIATIYGPEEGGIGAAFRETGKMAATAATKFAPLLVALALVTAGIAGMTYEINRSQKVQVSFGDVALGVLQTIGDGVMGLVRMLGGVLAPAFGAVFGFVEDLVHDVGNKLVIGLLGSLEIVKFAISSIPDAFIVAGEAAANGFISAIEWMVRQVLSAIDTLIGGINSFVGAIGGDDLKEQLGLDLSIPTLSDPNNPFTLGRAQFGGEDAKKRLAAGFNDLLKNADSIAGTDWMNEFYGNVRDHAIANALAGQKGKKTGRLSDYDRAIENTRDRTAAMQAEAKVIGLSTFAAEKMRKQMELENEARKDAIGLSPARIAEIDRESTAYARQAATLETLNAIYDTGKETFEGLFASVAHNLDEGQGLWEAWGNAAIDALDRLRDKALDAAADGIWDMIFGAVSGAVTGGAGGGIGGFFSSLFGGGGSKLANAPKNASGSDYWRGGRTEINEVGGEIVNLPSGAQIIPHDVSMEMARGGNGQMLNFAPVTHIDARGSQISQAQIEQVLEANNEAMFNKLRYFMAHPRRAG